MNSRTPIFTLLLISLVLGSILGCKRESTTPEPMPVGTTPEEFFRSLPSWETFADNPPEAEAAPTGAAGSEVSQTVDVPQIQEDGSIDTLYNVTYTCQQTPYSLTNNPEQIVMYSPDAEILWPGALIQGASHKDPVGSLRGLVIRERDSINVSIPNLPTGQNFRRVKPNQAVVASAIGEMVGNATADNLSTPSTISFSMETYHSERQMALSMGLSGRYLGFSGSASGSLARNQSETTVTVQFFQKMFEVLVEPPQSPAAFFSDEFTSEVLQEQVDLGRMGPNNLPVYVSNVVYGRMMMFSLTSTASETEIRTMMNAAYSNLAGNVRASMNAKQKTILDESKIAITSLGGDAQATIDMIRSGNWRDYFTNTAPLSSAAPLSYTFRNLGDGSIANIVETDEFTISECTEKIGVPGVFDFLPVQSENLGDIGFPAEAFTGDFNGDGLGDVMLNHKQGSLNQIKIGYGTVAGDFDFLPTVSNREAPAGSWESYATHLADLNGDGQTDIAWNRLTPSHNQTYVALNQGGGSFSYTEGSTFPGSGWDKYDLLVGDTDHDGRDELLWNITDDCCVNRTYVGNYREGDGSIIYSAPNDFGSIWGVYQAFVGNVNGGGDDLIFNALTSVNGLYVGLSNNDTTFTLSPYNRRSEGGWGSYQAFPGFADNNTSTDMIYNNVISSDLNRVYASLSNGDGTFDLSIGPQDHPVRQVWDPYVTRVGDVDGDGIDDLVWTSQEIGKVSTDVYVALGTNTGLYDFSPVKQDHPYQETWSQYTILLMDVNGDTHQDLIWIKPGSNTAYYVALAK
jgi:hypothetical protein